MFKRKKSLAMAVFCAVASVGFVANVHAEELDNKVPLTFALDTMVVEAQRDALPGGFLSREGNLGRLGNKDIMDVPFTQTSFTNKTVTTYNNPSAQLTNVLVNTPSVKSSSYTLYNDFSIRGLGMTGYNLYVNGVPGMFTQSTIPTDFAERVEIIAGPAMGFNGTTTRQSAGGLVNMYTKRAGEEDVTRFTQTFSGSSSWGERLDIGRRFGRNDEWGIRVNAQNTQGKELKGVGEELTNRDIFINIDHHDANSKTNLFGGYSYSKLDHSMRWFQFTSGVSSLPDAPDNKMNYAYKGQGATLDRWMAVLNHEQKVNDELTAFVNAGFSRYDLSRNITGRASEPYKVINNKGDFESVDRDGPLALTNYYAETGIKGEVYLGEVKNNIVLSIDKSWCTQWSGSGNKPSAYAGNIYEGRLDNFNPDLGTNSYSKNSYNQYWGIALVDTLEYGKAQLMLGVHNQHSEVESYKSDGTVKSNISSSATSPLAGFIYKPTEEVAFYASHTESFGGGAAVTNDKYTGNKGAILDPAKTKQNEIGVKYENAGVLTTLSIFDIKKAGTMDEEIDGKLYCLQNAEDEYKGVELSVNGKLADKWNIMGGLMYLDAVHNKTTDGKYDGDRIAGASKWNGVLSMEYVADEDFSVIGRALYNGSSEINNGKLKVPSYMTFDMGVQYKTKVNTVPVTLSAMCYNVFDKDYWQAQSGTNYLALANPRTFMVSAQFDL